MLSTQFLEILNICKAYNIQISYLDGSALCNLESDVFKRILKYFETCPEERKVIFAQILLDRNFINLYGYEDILHAIAYIKEEHYEDIFKILTTPNITLVPKMAEYIKILYLLSAQPTKLLSRDVVTDIAKVVPNIEFGDDAYIIRDYLISAFGSDYSIYVECDEEICFEDEPEGFTKDLEKAFRFHYQETKMDVHKLVRKIKSENMPRLKPRNQTKNILYLYPKKED